MPHPISMATMNTTFALDGPLQVDVGMTVILTPNDDTPFVEHVIVTLPTMEGLRLQWSTTLALDEGGQLELPRRRCRVNFFMQKFHQKDGPICFRFPPPTRLRPHRSTLRRIKHYDFFDQSNHIVQAVRILGHTSVANRS